MITAAIRIVAAITTFAFVSVMAIWLEPAAYGVFGFFISTALFAAAAGGYGQRERVMREVSRALAHNDTEAARRRVQASGHAVLWTGPAAGMIATVVLWTSGVPLLLALSIVPLTALLSLNDAWSGAARAQGHFFWALAPRDVLWRGASVMLFGLVLLLGGVERAAQLTTTSHVAIACTIMAMVGVLGLQGSVLGFWSGLFARPSAHDWPDRRSSTDFAVMRLASLAFVTLDVVFIGMALPAEMVAQYFPANRLALIGALVFVALNLLIAPRLARLFELSDLAGAQRLCSRATIFALAIGGAIGVALILGFDIYRPLFPPATDQTLRVLVFLTVAAVVDGGLGFGGIALSMAGHEARLRQISLVSVALGAPLIALSAFASGSIVTVAAVTMAVTVLRKVWITATAYKLTSIVPVRVADLRRSTLSRETE